MVNISISPDRNKLAIIPRGYDPEVIRMMENVPGKRWMRQFNCWFAPFSNETLIYIKSLLSQVTEISVDQKVQDFLNDQDTRANSIIDLKTQPVTDATLPADLTFTTKPFDHQKIAISLGLKNRNFAFFMEMGTGKTKVILDIIGYYLPKIKELRRPALVVCPVSVLWNWEVQIKKHRPELKVQVLSGSLNGKIMGLISDADVFIVNYESAWRMYESLAKIKWGFVILDESTRIKNRAAKQAKAMIKLGSVASRRYILTGTPAPNSPLELYNQIRFLDPNVFGDNWYFFRDRYCIMGGYGGYQVLGYKNLEELSKKVSGISYRVLKSECLDLPDKIYKQYRMPMTTVQAKAYKELSEELVTEVDGTEIRAEVVLAKLTKLRQIASGFVYLPDKSFKFESNKLEKLEEIVLEYAKNHKIVIWASFKEELNIISKKLDEHKIVHSILDGSTAPLQRQAMIGSFMNDPNHRIFLANQRAGGIGIDLYAADYCIFYSNDYSPEIRLQAEDRLHRIGQKNHVTYIDLISKGSIDSTISWLLVHKQDLSNQVMSGKIKFKEIMYGNDNE